MIVRRLLGGLVAAIVATAAWAQPVNPFLERTVDLSRAYGLAMVDVRLRVIEAYVPLPDELAEVLEEIEESDFARFMPTLSILDPELAEALGEAAETLEDTVASGGDPTGDASNLRSLLGQAAAVLFPDGDTFDPVFEAATLANLLLVDDGVAEAVEDAVESGNVWEYPGGWAALQRVKEGWAVLAPFANAEQTSTVEQYLAFLDEIYPSAAIPAKLPDSPEEAEAPAQSLVGQFEAITGAELYAGRDLARLSGHLADLTASACAAYDAGEDGAGLEIALAVGMNYAAHLGGLAGLFVPDAADEVAEAFESLGVEIEIEGSEEEEGEDDEDDDDEHAGVDGREACEELLEGMEAVRAALGG